jgi:cation:H+ antiporter
MDLLTMILFVVGIGLLIGGAELLVRGASRLAAAVGVSPLVIGLTVVAYGTSSPELAVSIQAGLVGQADIALGNVVGSNIFNVLFILGISALIAPLVVSQQLIRLDVPLMIGVSFLLLFLGWDGKIGRFDGLLLFAGAVSYTIFAIYYGRRENEDIQTIYVQKFGPKNGRNWLVNIGLIVGGLVALGVGSNWLVDGAVALARTLGVSELIIGLTIVAVGTSLPEVATSILASVRGERDIAVGNLIGSNIFNILVILGAAGLTSPTGINVPAVALASDIPIMIGVAVACLPIFFTGHLIARWEGGLFFAYYIIYTLYLIFGATNSPILSTFNAVMMFILPLTVITLLVSAVRALRTNQAPVRQT